MNHLLALVGVLSISFSAVFVRLANVSPVTATFYRSAYALPVLLLAWMAGRSRDQRTASGRWLAVASGLFLAADLDVWHESIALIGAGLATVVANSQIVFILLAAWLFHGERPTLRTTTIVCVSFVGLTLISGLGRGDAYGANPVTGVAFGLVAGFCYAMFLLLYRASNRLQGPVAGPLLDATIGTFAGAVVSMPLDPRLALTPSWPAHGWLALLALVAQVIGWMLIGTAMPRLPVVETSLLIMVQPVFAVLWGQVIFAERLSVLQWVGAGGVVMSVGALSLVRQREG